VDVYLVRSFREIALPGDRGRNPVMPRDRGVLSRGERHPHMHDLHTGGQSGTSHAPYPVE
jgi:hypothetical protein